MPQVPFVLTLGEIAFDSSKCFADGASLNGTGIGTDVEGPVHGISWHETAPWEMGCNILANSCKSAGDRLNPVQDRGFPMWTFRLRQVFH
jgi:hypothetical protein